MPSHDPAVIFNEKHAAEYDQRFAKLAPMRDALHLLTGAVLGELPADARILCVGAGTGAELLYLAAKFPQWRFTAVDPSGPMLDVCRRRVADAGLTERCEFHQGFLRSLPPAEPFDAATSLLVSQFILEPDARAEFFRAIATRLRPGGYVVNADLASDLTSSTYESLLGVWFRLMIEAGHTPDKLENLRVAYGRDVALLPLAEVSALMSAGGFTTPVLFLQTCLIHAWYARTPVGA